MFCVYWANTTEPAFLRLFQHRDSVLSASRVGWDELFSYLFSVCFQWEDKTHINHDSYAAMQSQKTVFVYFTSEQILYFGFARQYVSYQHAIRPI